MKINNYHKKMLEILEGLKDGEKPKILMHTCCGPCFTIPYEYLKDKFEITLFFNNSNIYPREEHDRRLAELKKYLNIKHSHINVIEMPYDYDNYVKDFKGHENDREGSERCFICYEKRLKQTFMYASEHGFDYVGSVMSISRYKNAKKLNEIGEKLALEYPNIKWLYADFKKQNGYEKSLEICDENGLYRQEYCGCEFSQKRLKKE